MKKKDGLILEVGAEGGSLSVFRYVDRDGNQRFYRSTNQAMLHDLMVGEDLGPSGHVSGSVATMAEVFELLDEYKWAWLHVLHVDPDIAGEVWEAVQARLDHDRDEPREREWVLERWAEFCGVRRFPERFVFIRHGKPISKEGMKSKKEQDARPLAPEGTEDARRAGEFLKKMGIKPDLVVTTKTRRTIDTADLVMKVLDVDAPIARVESGFKVNASLSDISGRVRAWIGERKPVPRVVFFVGHEIQQKALAKANRLEVLSDRYGVVLVHEIDAYGNWKQPQCFVGE